MLKLYVGSQDVLRGKNGTDLFYYLVMFDLAQILNAAAEAKKVGCWFLFVLCERYFAI